MKRKVFMQMGKVWTLEYTMFSIVEGEVIAKPSEKETKDSSIKQCLFVQIQLKYTIKYTINWM